MAQQLNLNPFAIEEFALGKTMGTFLALFTLDLVIQLSEQYRDAVEALDAVERAMDGD